MISGGGGGGGTNPSTYSGNVCITYSIWNGKSEANSLRIVYAVITLGIRSADGSDEMSL